MKHSRILSVITSLSLGMTLSACGNSAQSGAADSAERTVFRTVKRQFKHSYCIFFRSRRFDLNGADAVAGASVVVKDSEKLGNTAVFGGSKIKEK